MTTYTVHPIDEALLARLWDHLWQRGKLELAKLGYSLSSGYREFLSLADRAIDSGILCADGEPVAVSGICPEDGCYFTFFQASESFNDHAKKITRELRRHTKQCEGTLYIYSVLVHPETERWFNVLGFERDGWCGRTSVGHPIYRFRRK